MKKTTILKSLLFGLPLMAAVLVGTPAQAEWHFGIGTGLTLMSASGDMGFNVDIVNRPVQFDLNLNPGDFQDMTKTAFGFGGYATDGKWMIQYTLFNLELEDDASVVLPGGQTKVNGSFGFTMRGGGNYCRLSRLLHGFLAFEGAYRRPIHKT